MIKPVTIEAYMSMGNTIPVADVRTPAEFAHGHIPGAHNLPLFSNEERVQVGTTYKQVGREAAILLGFDLTGSKWSGFIRRALELAPGKKIAVHCWRGGMRSGAMAWALDLYGFDVWLVQGGYKKFRNWAIKQFEEPVNLRIIGGMTGSGKTKILHQLRANGKQVIDLEDIAQHQGSTYGTLNRLVQPTQEQFENDLAVQLYTADKTDTVWIEDESAAIGKCSIPRPFWKQMKDADIIDLKIPLEERIDLLATEYGILDKQFLVECTERIRKRLGPEQTKHTIEAINGNRIKDFIRQVLVYYDKTYRSGLARRNPEQVLSIQSDTSDPVCNAGLIVEAISKQDRKVH